MLHILLSFTFACLIYIVLAFLYSQMVGEESCMKIRLSVVYVWKAMVFSFMLSLIVSLQ